MALPASLWLYYALSLLLSVIGVVSISLCPTSSTLVALVLLPLPYHLLFVSTTLHSSLRLCSGRFISVTLSRLSMYRALTSHPLSYSAAVTAAAAPVLFQLSHALTFRVPSQTRPEHIGSYDLHTDWVNDIAICEDVDFMISASSDASLKVRRRVARTMCVAFTSSAPSSTRVVCTFSNRCGK